MTFFEKIVLKSTNMLRQDSYSIDEASVILDTNKKNVQRYIQNHKNQTGKIRLRVEKDGTILYDTFVRFFKKGRYII